MKNLKLITLLLITFVVTLSCGIVLSACGIDLSDLTNADNTYKIFDGSEKVEKEEEKEEEDTFSESEITAEVRKKGTYGVKYVLNEDGKSYYVSSCILSTNSYAVVGTTYNDLPVTGIGPNAFKGNPGLKYVVLPYTITWLDDYAFNYCMTLKKITLPERLQTIGDYAFAHCQKLTSISIPKKVESIGKDAFFDCINLEEITIADGVKEIKDEAFMWCKGPSKLVIPGSVTSIGKSAFIRCESIKELEIQDGVKSIDSQAFSSCTSLKTITMANSVTTIDKTAFDKTAYYDNQDNWSNGLFYVDNYLLLASADVTKCELKSNTNAIASDCFEECENLEEVTINEGVTSIGQGMFSKKAKLKSITIPSTVTYIGENAFEDCTGLTAVYISDVAVWCAIDFESNPLQYAGKLYLDGNLIKNLVIPDGVTVINKNAFENCSDIRSIIIPESVTEIEEGAFNMCSGLTNIYLKCTNEQKQVYNISIGENNTYFSYARFYYYCETTPTESGNWWHYDVDAKTPLIWN